MSVAVDVGGWQIRSLRRGGEALSGRRQRLCWLMVADTPSIRRDVVASRLPFVRCDANLILMGAAALEWSRSRRVPVNDLLPGGMVPAKDPIARQLVQAVIETVVPTAQAPAEICMLVQPAQVLTTGDERADCAAFFQRLLSMRGYDPVAISSGLSLVHAELARESFTGLAIVWGASGAEICIARQGIPVLEHSIPRGGRWLDDQIARSCEMVHRDTSRWVRYDLEQAAQLRESATGALLTPTIRAEEWIQQFVHEMVQHSVAELVRVLDPLAGHPDLQRPLPVICAGGLFETPGFLTLLTSRLEQVRIPLRLRAPRVARSSPFSVARGALIAAELEENARLFRNAA